MTTEGQSEQGTTPAAETPPPPPPAANQDASAPPPGNNGGPTTPPPASSTPPAPPPPPAPPKKDRALRCMGKKPPRLDHRTLQMKTYLPTSLAPPPPSTNYRASVPAGGWGMMLNDKLGDCTGAAAGHAEIGWTATNGKPCEVTDQDVEGFYEGSTGYNPDDPSSDQGGVELDVLNYWRNTGMAGKKIKAFVALEPKNHVHVQQAVYIFRGAYIGLALPLSAQDQDDWTVDESGNAGDPTAGSWGGHAVWVIDYDADWLYVITWGEVKRMSWAFWNAYCDESYAVLAEEAEAPSSFDYAQLEADLAVVSDPKTSIRPDVNAAARARDPNVVDEKDWALTVTKTLYEFGGGEVKATNKAGVELGVMVIPDLTDSGEPPDVSLRLFVGGKGHVVNFRATDLAEVMDALSDIGRHRPPRRPPDPPEEREGVTGEGEVRS